MQLDFQPTAIVRLHVLVPIKPPLQQSDTARAPCVWIEREGRGQKTKISQPTPRRIEKESSEPKGWRGKKSNAEEIPSGDCANDDTLLAEKRHTFQRAQRMWVPTWSSATWTYTCSAAAHEQITHTHRKNLHTKSPSNKIWASSCGQKAGPRQPTTSVKSCVRKMCIYFSTCSFFVFCSLFSACRYFFPRQIHSRSSCHCHFLGCHHLKRWDSATSDTMQHNRWASCWVSFTVHWQQWRTVALPRPPTACL